MFGKQFIYTLYTIVGSRAVARDVTERPHLLLPQSYPVVSPRLTRICDNTTGNWHCDNPLTLFKCHHFYMQVSVCAPFILYNSNTFTDLWNPLYSLDRGWFHPRVLGPAFISHEPPSPIPKAWKPLTSCSCL